MSITMGDVSRFKFLAHKVMPLVFDESLSYYEFLCKVIAKLNEVIDNENEQNSVLEDFSEQMNDWNEEMLAKYTEFTNRIDGMITEFETQVTQGQTEFETEMDERADAFEADMQEQWDGFFERYLQTLGVVQETGSSTTDVMSQKAVTDEVNRRIVVDGATGVGLRSARNASGEGNTGVGENAIQFVTTGARNTGVGFNAGNPNATGNYNTNVGYNSRTSANDTFSATAVGRETRVASQSVAVGDSAKAEGALGTAVGNTANASGARSMALGAKTNASYAGSVAIGTDKMNNGATTTAEEEIVLGTERHTVKIPGRLANPQIDGATLNSPILQSSTVINGGTSNGTRLNNPNLYDASVRATVPNPVLGDELVSNIATWGSENATYDSDTGRWTISAGGVIRGNIEVSANVPYLMTLTVVANTAITPNERVIPCHIALGDDSIDIMGANDANWKVLLIPETGGTVVASIGGGEWYGTVSGVSIKEVTDFADFQLMFQGTTKGIAMPSSSVYIGTGGTKCALGNSRNVGIGFHAQDNLETGEGNVGIGEYAQQNIKNGSHNVGIGQSAQKALTTGMYNFAVGYSAQSKLTSGTWNVAMGNEAQRDLTTGCNNVSLGRRAHNDMTTGNKNVAIGAQAGFARKTTGEQTTTAYSTKTAEEQVLIGFQATQTANSSAANGAIAIGARSMANTDGIAIGRECKAMAAGSVAIGRDSSGNSVEVENENEIAIGTTNHTIKLCGKVIRFNSDGTVTWIMHN